MTMYHLLFQTQPSAEVVLAMLKLLPQDIARFRDAWVGDDCLVILTRQGNDPQPELRERSDHITDFADPYDGTYRHFQFAVPEPFKEWTGKLKAMQHPTPGDLKARTDEVLK